MKSSSAAVDREQAEKMHGVLAVVDAFGRKLHQQTIEFEEMPKRGRLFRCQDRRGQPFATAKVEDDPVERSRDTLDFSTRTTRYVLEIARR